MKKVIVALALSAVAFGASAAQLITKEEVKHFKLTKVGPISVGPSGGECCGQVFLDTPIRW